MVREKGPVASHGSDGLVADGYDLDRLLPARRFVGHRGPGSFAHEGLAERGTGRDHRGPRYALLDGAHQVTLDFLVVDVTEADGHSGGHLFGRAALDHFGVLQ